MGLRQGGSYAADKSGTEKLQERTDQPEGFRLLEDVPAGPELATAPAVPADEPTTSGRRRSGGAGQPQE